MLKLWRNLCERIMIGDDIVVQVTAINDRDVKIGIQAPPTVTIHRKEVAERIRRGLPRRNGRRQP